MINIRRAKHSDAQHIISSHLRSIREVCSKDYTPEEIEAWPIQNFNAELWCRAMDRDFVWVVEVNSQVRGFGHLAISNSNNAEVMGLYFAPEARGLGSGKKLLTIMKEEAKTRGIKKLQLQATLTAKSFYENNGFRQLESKCSLEKPKVQISCLPMECTL